MTGPGLLENMSVPPRYALKVETPRLPGTAFRFLVRGSTWRGFWQDAPPEREPLEKAVAEAGLPDRVGVFVKGDGPADARNLSLPAACAVLSRRSGSLYLPWRAVDPELVPRGYPLGPQAPSLLESAFFVLVFPEEGEPS